MKGWNGRLLRVDLSKRKAGAQKYDAGLARNFLGGRGFAVKILWDELKFGVDALSAENKLLLVAGPLSGFLLPSSGKLVVAAKSPLTGGYGDGNLGTVLTVQLRRAGYDGVIFEGKAKKPVYIWINDGKTEIFDAGDLWGLGSFKTEKEVEGTHGKTTGVLSIGPAGENMVKFANIVSQQGRAGGRAGMGAVMGSKNLKAVAIKGTNEIPAADPNELKRLGTDALREILKKPNYDFWKRQGTMATTEWSQENSVLPTNNFREGVFDEAESISGFMMEKMKVSNRGCPNCNMTCGNVIKDSTNAPSELDYENVAMLGSNISLGNLKEVASLNRLADDWGIDTISLGNVIGFAMEASERNLLDYEIEWGDFDKAKALAEDIVCTRGIGRTLAEGTRFASEKLGGDASEWAMHVKGLEITGYDCHVAPGMALSYGTCSIGAHHKDAWIISWEVSYGRESYAEAKVDKIIELQRIRGGIFECLTTCRLPWIELGFELDWYPKFLRAATGENLTMHDLIVIADRVLNLARAFWIREYQRHWSTAMDSLPPRWFKEPLTRGPFKGKALERENYYSMLQLYYSKRGWDTRGIPTQTTLEKLGLLDVARELLRYVELTK